jgi:hypothetical protein
MRWAGKESSHESTGTPGDGGEDQQKFRGGRHAGEQPGGMIVLVGEQTVRPITRR